MRYHLFLQYGWFLQNLGKDFIRTNMHTTVCSWCWLGNGDWWLRTLRSHGERRKTELTVICAAHRGLTNFSRICRRTWLNSAFYKLLSCATVRGVAPPSPHCLARSGGGGRTCMVCAWKTYSLQSVPASPALSPPTLLTYFPYIQRARQKYDQN